MFIIYYDDGIKCLSNLLQLQQPCNVLFHVIFDIMPHWYEMWNTIVIVISFCTGKKMMNHVNVMFKVISDIMAHLYDLWNTILIANNFFNWNKMICALISNHYGIKCLSNPFQLQPIVIAINFNQLICEIQLISVKTMICALMFIISRNKMF